MEQKKIQEILRRADQVRGKQSSWNSYYDDLARVFWPGMLGFATSKADGDRNEDIFDGLPMQAARNFANTIVDIMWPNDGTDIRIRATDDELNQNYNARLWLDDASDRLRTAMYHPKARLEQCNDSTARGLVVFGIAPFFLGELQSKNGLSFQAIKPNNLSVEWGEEGPLAAYRFRQINVNQAIQLFGEENLGKRAQELIKQKAWDVKLSYVHAVTGRKENPGKLSKRMPWASLWIERESEHIVSESGYHEFPYITPRMGSAPEEDIGQSPAMIALPDANTLQAMGETILIAGQRAADPPIFAPNDGSFSEANTFPGGISYYDADTASRMRGNPIFPLDTGHNLPITRDMQRDVREQVANAFFKDVLMLPEGKERRTATEVLKRSEELQRVIGPEIKRLETEWKAPTIERAFNIMLRAGAFAEIPQELAGRDVRFEYESPIRRMKQSIEIETAHILRDEFMVMANVSPTVMDHFNIDEYMRYMANALRVPMRLLNPTEMVQQKREADAQAQAMQAEMMEASEMANIANTGAGAIKQLTDAGAAGASGARA